MKGYYIENDSQLLSISPKHRTWAATIQSRRTKKMVVDHEGDGDCVHDDDQIASGIEKTWTKI